EAVEQRQAEGDQDAARRRRRVRDDLVAAEAGADRAAPDDPVAGEVLEREVPAALPRGGRERPRPLAAVERGGAPARDRLERVGELREAQRVPGDEPLARRPAVEAATLRRGAQDRV